MGQQEAREASGVNVAGDCTALVLHCLPVAAFWRSHNQPTYEQKLTFGTVLVYLGHVGI